MNKTTIGCALIAAAVGVSLMGGKSPATPVSGQGVKTAGTILIHGTVLTVDAKDSMAQAIALDGSRIVAVGTDAEIQALAGPNTRILDLRGRTVTPGLIDTHCHFQEVGEIYGINLSDSSIGSLKDIVALVKARADAAKPGEWIEGSGWDEGKLAERRYVTAADLDAVAPKNPVWLEHTTGHYGVANSAALAMADINAATKNPVAGTIDRDADGRPTGVLKESAQALVTKMVPPYTHDQRKNGLLKIIADFHREGMTGVKNPGIEEEDWQLYQELLREHKLDMRLFALWRSQPVPGSAERLVARLGQLPKRQAQDGMLISGGVKIFMDGSGGGRTAWMYNEWNIGGTKVDTGNFGYPSIAPDLYRDQVQMFHKAGLHVSTHAIGDRAIDWVIDTYAKVLAETPTKGLRHGLIHGNFPTEHAIDTMVRLQRDYDSGYPELQAPFLWWIGDNYAGNLGPDRAQHLIPLKTFQQKGLLWAGGSDYPVTPYPARYGLWASVARETLHGRYGKTPFGTAEGVDIHTALRSYTAWAARQLFLEDKVGSIEVGKEADLAVWDRNPYTVPTAELAKLQCQMTMLGGRIVYDAAVGK